jgi:hypothetical protein
VTLEKARRELMRPLIFGDEAQIEAKRFLVLLANTVEAIRECPHHGEVYDCFECWCTVCLELDELRALEELLKEYGGDVTRLFERQEAA